MVLFPGTAPPSLLLLLKSARGAHIATASAFYNMIRSFISESPKEDTSDDPARYRRAQTGGKLCVCVRPILLAARNSQVAEPPRFGHEACGDGESMGKKPAR